MKLDAGTGKLGSWNRPVQGLRPPAAPNDATLPQGRPAQPPGVEALPDLGRARSRMRLPEELAILDATPHARTPEEARQQANAIWFTGTTGDSGYYQVEQDAVDVNDPPVSLSGLFPGSDSPTPDARAARQVEKNRALEKHALEGLSPRDRERYQAVKEQLKDDPQAQLALQLLLIEQKLPGSKNEAGKDVLQALAVLANPKTQLAKGIHRQDLLGQLVRELATPSAINQHGKGTCTVTSMQIMMAREHPAEYVRIVAGLASPEGTVTLADGSTLVREPGTVGNDGSGRSIPSRLWQPALMEFANGENVDYDNVKDQHSDTGHSGLSEDRIDKAMDALLGKNVATLNVQDEGLEAVMREIGRSTEAGHGVPVAMRWGVPGPDGQYPGSHEILVTKIENGRVYFTNPQGSEDSMTLEEFEKRLLWASIQDKTTNALPIARAFSVGRDIRRDPRPE